MTDISLINQYVAQHFPGFGINKRHEVARLLYEISLRQNIAFDVILPPDVISSKDFFQIKSRLVALRYPSLDPNDRSQIPPLGELKLIPDHRVVLDSVSSGIKNIFFEKSVAESELVCRLKEYFPDIRFHEIGAYRDVVKSQGFSIPDYNRRHETLFVVKEDFDLFLHCPCSVPSRACGYHIMNAGMGCAFECVYCYLQGYVNAPGLVIPGNLSEMLEQFKAYYRPGMRIGTGQFTDSLIFDHLTGFSSQIIDFFQQYPDVTFEFKTKSKNIGNILNQKAPKNIVISWSVNPSGVIKDTELLTASLEDRLKAAKQCAEAGYRVGFHFDPIVYYEGWGSDYEKVVRDIFDVINAEDVAWISLGCLRMTAGTRRVMEQRFPDSWLLLAEQIIGFDGKLRYPREVRKNIYQVMLRSIQRCAPQVCVYLCMEDELMNRGLNVPVIAGCIS